MLCLVILLGDDIILRSTHIPPGDYDLNIEAQSINGRSFSETSIPVSISKQRFVLILCSSNIIKFSWISVAHTLGNKN